MLEAGSSTRTRNKARLTPLQLVDPANPGLRDLIQKHEYAELNAGDFVDDSNSKNNEAGNAKGNSAAANAFFDSHDGDDDDAEFSGSDEEERAEWERRRKNKGR